MGPRLGAVAPCPRFAQLGVGSGIGPVEHLLESMLSGPSQHLLSPGGEEEVCRPAGPPTNAQPMVWVRPRRWEGSRGAEGGPGSLRAPCRQAAFQDVGDVLFSSRSGKTRSWGELESGPGWSQGPNSVGFLVHEMPQTGRS